MRRTAFRMIAALSGILLIMLLILMSVVMRVVWGGYADEFAEIMLSEANGLSERVSLDFPYRVISPTLSFELSRITKNYSARIYIAYNNGYIWRFAEDGESNEPYFQYLDEELTRHFLNPVIEDGESIAKMGFKYMGERLAAAAVSIKTSFRTDGVVIVLASLGSVREAVDQLRPKIYLFGGLIFFFGVLVFSALAFGFTRPFRDISRAAREHSEGAYKKIRYSGSNPDVREITDAVNELLQSMSSTRNIKMDFVANVSHELRSPLTSMQGFLQAMRDGVVADDEREQYLDIVLSETKRLSKLVNDLLTLSQIENSKLKLDKKVFDICEVARKSIIKFETRFTDKNIFASMISRQDSCMVYADEDRITQVIDNLIDNALKFAPEDGRITIIISRGKDDTFISVLDDGCGIKKQDIPRLFERFYTANRAHTSGSGTGLGLAMVKNILEQQGGSIRVASVYGQGSLFTFTLKNDAAGPSGAAKA